jgi:hypothetical protein
LSPGRKRRKVKTPKKVLSSIPGEGGSCSSETKNDRRTAPRPKLFVSKKRLQKQGPQHRKLSWIRVLTRVVFLLLGNSAREKNGAKAKFVGFGEEITGTKGTNPRTALGLSPCEDIGFRNTFFHVISTIRIK